MSYAARILIVQGGVISFFGFRRRDVADRLEKPAIVEPVDPFECRVFDRLEQPPWPTPMDDLRLIEPVDGLGQVLAPQYEVSVATTG